MKILIWITLFFLTANSALTQTAEKAPPGAYTSPPSTGTFAVDMWDVIFEYDVSTITDQNSQAGCVHIGTEFWTSVWNSDLILRFDNDGNYIETTNLTDSNGDVITGVRSMSWDGTNVWATNNTFTIYQIDVSSMSAVGSVNVVGFSDNVRFATFDANADGGNGGFWIGNFNTPVALVDLSGNILQSIPQTTHTLGGMYGAAIDNSSPGGPYLWVFHQAGTPSDAIISQLQLPDATPTGIIRDASADFPGVVDPLAGGMFIIEDWDGSGQRILGGILQNSPDFMVGYELDFMLGEIIDVSLSAIVDIPNSECDLSAQESITVSITNTGDTIVDNIQLEIEVNGTVVTTDTYAGSLNPGEEGNHMFTNIDLSTPGGYFITIKAIADGDINNSNDQLNVFRSSRTFGSPPVIDDFDAYTDGDVVFTNLYNPGSMDNSVALFQANSGDTPSDNTGPLDDADGGGSYIYMESSPLEAGGVGVLITDCLDLSGFEIVRLGFSYHMFGNGIGSLEVDAVTDNSSTNLLTLIGEQQTSNAASWEPVFIDLTQFVDVEDIQILFRGTVGTGGLPFNSDIALDNISIVGCTGFSDGLSGMVTDANDNNGAIDLSVSGGVSPYSYEWSNGATTEDITDLAPEMYSVTVTDDLGCTGEISFEILNTSIENVNGLEAFSIQPNLTKGPVNIILDMETASTVSLQVLDATGREIEKIPAGTATTQHRFELDLSENANGMYFVQLLIDQQVLTQKIILAK